MRVDFISAICLTLVNHTCRAARTMSVCWTKMPLESFNKVPLKLYFKNLHFISSNVVVNASS